MLLDREEHFLMLDVVLGFYEIPPPPRTMMLKGWEFRPHKVPYKSFGEGSLHLQVPKLNPDGSCIR